MVQQFPVTTMVQRCPGADRPGVIQLPEQGSHAVRFQAPPIGNRGVNGEGLLHLADIDKILKSVWKAEIAKHGFGDAGIAALVLLMAFHHRRGNVEILMVGEFADDRH